MKKFIKFIGITLVPLGLYEKSKKPYIRVAFTNYLEKKYIGNSGIVKMFGPKTSSILLAHFIFLGALIYSFFLFPASRLI